MPNDVVQYALTLSVGSSGTPIVGSIPLIVPDQRCFRVRHVEFRIQSISESDSAYQLGVSRSAVAQAMPSVASLLSFNAFLAFWGQATQIGGTTGMRHVPLSRRIELWDYDYRLVMRPTFHFVFVGAGLTTTAVLAGEYVPCSMDQRNAIIINQGGAK